MCTSNFSQERLKIPRPDYYYIYTQKRPSRIPRTASEGAALTIYIETMGGQRDIEVIPYSKCEAIYSGGTLQKERECANGDLLHHLQPLSQSPAGWEGTMYGHVLLCFTQLAENMVMCAPMYIYPVKL